MCVEARLVLDAPGARRGPRDFVERDRVMCDDADVCKP